MELDFDTVKALSSRTRIKILNETIANESTPTDLSNKIGRSKSTVSSHLKKLTEAGLLEKDKVEGRRRVVYQPTDKTKTILKGKNRKVKFSILSSVSSAWIGLGLSSGALANILEDKDAEEAGRQMGSMALDQGAEAASAANQSMLNSVGLEDALLFAGLGFLTISVGGLIYGFIVSQIRS